MRGPCENHLRYAICNSRCQGHPICPVWRPARFFTEHFRKSDFGAIPRWVRTKCRLCNPTRVIRTGGWSGPALPVESVDGEMVRTVAGHMVDLAMDIRRGSPYYGKIIAYDMPRPGERRVQRMDLGSARFRPRQFLSRGHANRILLLGRVQPGCEAGISPLSGDLDWSLCEPGLRAAFAELASARRAVFGQGRNGLPCKPGRAIRQRKLHLRPMLNSGAGELNDDPTAANSGDRRQRPVGHRDVKSARRLLSRVGRVQRDRFRPDGRL